MPIITYENKTNELKEKIKTAFEEAFKESRETVCEEEESDYKTASDPIIEDMAEKLSEEIGDAIKDYIESITVKIQPGISAILQAPATVIGTAGTIPLTATVPAATIKTISEGTS